ncbi:MAG: ExeM/NucH family extracellular endonuclease [Vicinamibacteraceae bacterium]|nr:ExeM/NucH family extracellular endonuclease [Vicinamibacteraceae bacterium]
MMFTSRISLRLPGLALMLACLTFLVPARAAAQTDLFFSEYIEGTSNNKALEIYNGTGAPVDLAAGQYNIQMFFNGSTSAGLTINLTGTAASGDVYVVAHSSAVAAILAQADQTNGAGWFNGDDAVVLRKGTTVLDVIGQIGVDPGSQWGAGDQSTADNTLRRKVNLCAGDPDGADAFDPSVEWDGYATDTFDGLGAHVAVCGDAAPSVTSVVPADGAVNVPVDANLTVTFSEPVNVAGAWFGLACTVSGAKTATVSGGPTAFTLDPGTDFVPGDLCTLTVVAAQVSDQDADDPPDTMAADFSTGFATIPAVDPCTQPFTPIFSIQGSGASAAITGTVTTMGVVVGDFEGPTPTLRGFFLQDPAGDGDAATSDGIFVFNFNNDLVALGDLVRVTGNATEFQGQTQISASSLVACGTGTVSPVDVTFPVPSPDYLERFEGMLVRLPQTLTVTDVFDLGRFGQVMLSAGGRLAQPTEVALPGAPALAVQAANARNQILVDDDRNNQNADPIVFARGGMPLSASNTLRAGDTASGIVGVMTYTWGGQSESPNAYRVRPGASLGGVASFEAVNERPAAAPEVGGAIRVAGMNLLNYFNTFSGCTRGVGGAPVGCRGADSQAEFERQIPKTVAAILKTGADVLGLIEMENDGYGPDSAIQHLVDQLNAATSPGTYAFIDADLGTGQLNALGSDAVKNAILYKPAVVMPVATTAVLNTDTFQTGGNSTPGNRPALAQAFEHLAYGARFVVVVNHLRSKGSACDIPDAGDGQGNCNVVRVNAATELAAWLATDPTGAGEPDVLLLGDLNAYSMEDPVRVLETAGFTNLVPLLQPPVPYSYSFDGQWGSLDHALASPSLVGQVTGAAPYHINADEPAVLDYNTNFKSPGQQTSLYAPDEFRAADHDPLVVGLTLVVTFTGTDGRDVIVGTDGPDRIEGGRGGDTLTGLGGPDVFVYTHIRDANDRITDFTPGEDLIDLSALLRAAGYAGGDAIADGWVRIIPAGPQYMVQVDLDGPGPAYDFRQLLVVKGVPRGYVFTAADFIF